MTQTNNGPEAAIAVFIDFENFALGFEHSRKKFEIQKVIERLLEKGKIIVKRAYADWTRYREYKQILHEAAIELIEVPKRSTAGKNSADIRMCVDAIDMAHSKTHIDTFALLTGDSDFSPLIKDTRKRTKPQFDESYHGYRTFQDLLEDMERHGVLALMTDPRSGTFVVTGFGKKK